MHCFQHVSRVTETFAFVQMLEEDAMFKMQLPEQLTPTWKMLMLSDGSVTRHLQLLTGQHIEVVRLHMTLSFIKAMPHPVRIAAQGWH